MASDGEASCGSDPNFAVICSFLERFAKSCGITHPNISELQEMLENTQEVPQPLVELHVKLLRKARKSVSGERWERALIKFCHTYSSNQDGWEIERFGYKNARLGVKLRVLKTLLEQQFDLNAKFKAEVNRLSAVELRGRPLGRDKLGQTYWCQLDEACNLRVYREDLDDETWEVVASDREGLVQLMSQLSSNDPFRSGGETVVNEDSNSLGVEKPVTDTGQPKSLDTQDDDDDEDFQEIPSSDLDDDDSDNDNDTESKRIKEATSSLAGNHSSVIGNQSRRKEKDEETGLNFEIKKENVEFETKKESTEVKNDKEEGLEIGSKTKSTETDSKEVNSDIAGVTENLTADAKKESSDVEIKKDIPDEGKKEGSLKMENNKINSKTYSEKKSLEIDMGKKSLDVDIKKESSEINSKKECLETEIQKESLKTVNKKEKMEIESKQEISETKSKKECLETDSEKETLKTVNEKGEKEIESKQEISEINSTKGSSEIVGENESLEFSSKMEGLEINSKMDNSRIECLNTELAVVSNKECSTNSSSTELEKNMSESGIVKTTDLPNDSIENIISVHQNNNEGCGQVIEENKLHVNYEIIPNKNSTDVDKVEESNNKNGNLNESSRYQNQVTDEASKPKGKSEEKVHSHTEKPHGNTLEIPYLSKEDLVSNVVDNDTLVERNPSKRSSERATESISVKRMRISEVEANSDVKISEAIEEPLMLISGEGAGNDCEAGNIFEESDVEVGDAIEESLMLISGEGEGNDFVTGNLSKKSWSCERSTFEPPTVKMLCMLEAKDSSDVEVSEAIEEPLMLIYGDGSGKDCETGNPVKSGQSENSEGGHSDTKDLNEDSGLTQNASDNISKNPADRIPDVTVPSYCNSDTSVSEEINIGQSTDNKNEPAEPLLHNTWNKPLSEDFKINEITPSELKTSQEVNFAGKSAVSHSDKILKSVQELNSEAILPEQILNKDKVSEPTSVGSETSQQSSYKNAHTLWTIDTICATKDHLEDYNSDLLTEGWKSVGDPQGANLTEKSAKASLGVQIINKPHVGSLEKRVSRWDVGKPEVSSGVEFECQEETNKSNVSADRDFYNTEDQKLNELGSSEKHESLNNEENNGRTLVQKSSTFTDDNSSDLKVRNNTQKSTETEHEGKELSKGGPNKHEKYQNYKLTIKSSVSEGAQQDFDSSNSESSDCQRVETNLAESALTDKIRVASKSETDLGKNAAEFNVFSQTMSQVSENNLTNMSTAMKPNMQSILNSYNSDEESVQRISKERDEKVIQNQLTSHNVDPSKNKAKTDNVEDFGFLVTQASQRVGTDRFVKDGKNFLGDDFDTISPTTDSKDQGQLGSVSSNSPTLEALPLTKNLQKNYLKPSDNEFAKPLNLEKSNLADKMKSRSMPESMSTPLPAPSMLKSRDSHGAKSQQSFSSMGKNRRKSVESITMGIMSKLAAREHQKTAQIKSIDEVMGNNVPDPKKASTKISGIPSDTRMMDNKDYHPFSMDKMAEKQSSGRATDFSKPVEFQPPSTVPKKHGGLGFATEGLHQMGIPPLQGAMLDPLRQLTNLALLAQNPADAAFLTNSLAKRFDEIATRRDMESLGMEILKKTMDGRSLDSTMPVDLQMMGKFAAERKAALESQMKIPEMHLPNLEKSFAPFPAEKINMKEAADLNSLMKSTEMNKLAELALLKNFVSVSEPLAVKEQAWLCGAAMPLHNKPDLQSHFNLPYPNSSATHLYEDKLRLLSSGSREKGETKRMPEEIKHRDNRHVKRTETRRELGLENIRNKNLAYYSAIKDLSHVHRDHETNKSYPYGVPLCTRASVPTPKNQDIQLENLPQDLTISSTKHGTNLLHKPTEITMKPPELTVTQKTEAISLVKGTPYKNIPFENLNDDIIPTDYSSLSSLSAKKQAMSQKFNSVPVTQSLAAQNFEKSPFPQTFQTNVIDRISENPKPLDMKLSVAAETPKEKIHYGLKVKPLEKLSEVKLSEIVDIAKDIPSENSCISSEVSMCSKLESEKTSNSKKPPLEKTSGMTYPAAPTEKEDVAPNGIKIIPPEQLSDTKAAPEISEVTDKSQCEKLSFPETKVEQNCESETTADCAISKAQAQVKKVKDSANVVVDVKSSPVTGGKCGPELKILEDTIKNPNETRSVSSKPEASEELIIKDKEKMVSEGKPTLGKIQVRSFAKECNQSFANSESVVSSSERIEKEKSKSASKCKSPDVNLETDIDKTEGKVVVHKNQFDDSHLVSEKKDSEKEITSADDNSISKELEKSQHTDAIPVTKIKLRRGRRGHTVACSTETSEKLEKHKNEKSMKAEIPEKSKRKSLDSEKDNSDKGGVKKSVDNDNSASDNKKEDKKSGENVKGSSLLQSKNDICKGKSLNVEIVRLKIKSPKSINENFSFDFHENLNSKVTDESKNKNIAEEPISEVRRTRGRSGRFTKAQNTEAVKPSPKKEEAVDVHTNKDSERVVCNIKRSSLQSAEIVKTSGKKKEKGDSNASKDSERVVCNIKRSSLQNSESVKPTGKKLEIVDTRVNKDSERLVCNIKRSSFQNTDTGKSTSKKQETSDSHTRKDSERVVSKVKHTKSIRGGRRGLETRARASKDQSLQKQENAELTKSDNECKDELQMRLEEASSDDSQDRSTVQLRDTGKGGATRARGRGRGRGGRGSRSNRGGRGRGSSTIPSPTRDEDSLPPSSDTQPDPANTKNKRGHRKPNLMGLDVITDIVLGETKGDEGTTFEMPMRQSRRIAQIKIKEEAERRKIEELTYFQLKEDQCRFKKARKLESKATKLDKKKRKRKDGSDSDEDYTTGDRDETPSKRRGKQQQQPQQQQPQQQQKRRKKRKKKSGLSRFNQNNPWQSSSESSSSAEEEELEQTEEEEEEEEADLVFKSDHEFSPESDLEDATAGLPTRRARTAQKETEAEEPADEHACQKCGKSDHPEWILLCDKCDSGWHGSCLRPALLVIPEGDWFCPPCEHTALLANLEENLKELDRNLKRRENEELRRKRLAYVGISLDNVLPNKMDKEETEIASLPESKKSSSSSSSCTSSSDESEPVYQLRQRRQTVLSYRYNEYDDLIYSAIQDELEAVKGAGNQGRGKDISTIVNAEKEEDKEKVEAAEVKSEAEDIKEKKKPENGEEAEDSDDEEEDEPEGYIPPVRRYPLPKKKHRRLNSLDISSDDDDADSDEDFKGSSSEEEEEEEDEAADSDDSDAPARGRRGKKRHAEPVRRSSRARITRFDKEFINDDSEESDVPKRKKHRVWQDSESDESDWGKKKKKKNFAAVSKSRSKKKRKKLLFDSDLETYKKKKPKKPKVKFGGLDEDEVLVQRRTRGKKINYEEVAGSDTEEEVIKRSRRQVESEDEFVINNDEDDEEEEEPEPAIDDKDSTSESEKEKEEEREAINEKDQEQTESPVQSNNKMNLDKKKKHIIRDDSDNEMLQLEEEMERFVEEEQKNVGSCVEDNKADESEVPTESVDDKLKESLKLVAILEDSTNENTSADNLVNLNPASDNLISNKSPPSESLDSKNILSENVASKDLPPENMTTKNLPSDSAIVTDLPSKNQPTENLSSTTLTSENSPTKTLASENVSSNNLANENSSCKILDTENSHCEVLASENSHSEVTDSENFPCKIPDSENLPCKIPGSENLPCKISASENILSTTDTIHTESRPLENTHVRTISSEKGCFENMPIGTSLDPIPDMLPVPEVLSPTQDKKKRYVRKKPPQEKKERKKPVRKNKKADDMEMIMSEHQEQSYAQGNQLALSHPSEQDNPASSVQALRGMLEVQPLRGMIGMQQSYKTYMDPQGLTTPQTPLPLLGSTAAQIHQQQREQQQSLQQHQSQLQQHTQLHQLQHPQQSQPQPQQKQVQQVPPSIQQQHHQQLQTNQQLPSAQPLPLLQHQALPPPQQQQQQQMQKQQMPQQQMPQQQQQRQQQVPPQHVPQHHVQQHPVLQQSLPLPMQRLEAMHGKSIHNSQGVVGMQTDRNSEIAPLQSEQSNRLNVEVQSPPKRKGRGRGKATLAAAAAAAAESIVGAVDPARYPPQTQQPQQQLQPQPPQPPQSQQHYAPHGSPVSSNATSSVITRMLQTQPVSQHSQQSFTAAAAAMGHKYFGSNPDQRFTPVSPGKPGRIPSPYRQAPGPPANSTPAMMQQHYATRPGLVRPPPAGVSPVNQSMRSRGPAPQPSTLYHGSHHPLDPSPSGGGPISVAPGPNVVQRPVEGGQQPAPTMAVPVANGSPLGGKPTPVPVSLSTPPPQPPPPYTRPRFPPDVSQSPPGAPPAARHPFSSSAHMHAQPSPPPTLPPQHQQPAPHPLQQGRVPGNYAPYHAPPPPPPSYHYGNYPPHPSVTVADEVLQPAPYQGSPYTEQYVNPPIEPTHLQQLPDHSTSESRPYEEDTGGEFGGLVSYFSSQREDDLDA